MSLRNRVIFVDPTRPIIAMRNFNAFGKTYAPGDPFDVKDKPQRTLAMLWRHRRIGYKPEDAVAVDRAPESPTVDPASAPEPDVAEPAPAPDDLPPPPAARRKVKIVDTGKSWFAIFDAQTGEQISKKSRDRKELVAEAHLQSYDLIK